MDQISSIRLNKLHEDKTTTVSTYLEEIVCWGVKPLADFHQILDTALEDREEDRAISVSWLMNELHGKTEDLKEQLNHLWQRIKNIEMENRELKGRLIGNGADPYRKCEETATEAATA